MSFMASLKQLWRNLCARSRRRRIRKLLLDADVRALAWMPPADSPLSYQGTLVRLAMDRVIGPRTLAFGHWHDEHCQLIRNCLLPQRRYHLIDVGANAGLVSRQLLAGAPSLFSGADCFEPDPESFALLAANLAPFAQARCHQAALSDQDGEAQLFRGGRNAGDIALAPDAKLRASADLRGTVVRLLAAAPVARRLMAELPNADTRLVWKSDTQGHDLKIVAALPGDFWARVDVALIEVTSVATGADELERFMAALKQFPKLSSVKRGVTPISADAVRAHIVRANGSEFDLLLSR